MTTILQITDSHLGGDASYRLAGVDTQASFRAVIDRVVEREGYDLVLATGDLAAEANLDAYALFFEMSAELNAPLMWLPGNHDIVDTVESVAGAVPFADYQDAGNWRIMMLDSVIEHHPSGRLGQTEMNKLRRLLDENTQPNVLVCLHHQPVDVGCAWLDNQKIEDADEFLEIVESDNCVKGVLWGHVHQEFSCVRDGRLFFSTPSTCIQFKANSDDFALDSLYPGYRILELRDDGTIDTRVERVEMEGFNVDVDCQGY